MKANIFDTKAVVIASGQSLYDESVLDELKEHNVVILSTDRTLKYVLEKGITPSYACIQENLIEPNGHDLLPDFFYHGIVKSHSDKITLFYSQLLKYERLKILEEMSFKTIPFQRLGKGDGKGVIIDTCGNCGMALIQIARKMLKIEKIAVIGLDLDHSTSWKSYENTTITNAMLNNTKTMIASDFFDYGVYTYNLTKMGNFHGKGIKETSLNTFMTE